MIVGLTGGIGSGKTTVCNIFASLGVPIISADKISHELVRDNPVVREAIQQRFNITEINRAQLRERIFNSPANKLWLENLLHPLIKQAITLQTNNIKYPYCIVEIPLLLEAGMQDSVDRILSIHAPKSLRIERTIHRDNSPIEIIKAIIASQITAKDRLMRSDDIIENAANLDILKRRVQRQHEYYLSLSAATR